MGIIQFGIAERLVQRLRIGHLRLVPFAIVLGHGMNIVQGLVVVLKAYRLAGHHGDHVRNVAAAFLLNGDTLLRRIEVAIAQAVFHVNQHVGQMAIVDDNLLGCRAPLAAGIVRHVDWLGSGRSAFKADGAGDGGCGGRIDWCRFCCNVRVRRYNDRRTFIAADRKRYSQQYEEKTAVALANHVSDPYLMKPAL